jgi:hypothetical protein
LGERVGKVRERVRDWFVVRSRSLVGFGGGDVIFLVFDGFGSMEDW